ncbi:MAG: transposase, partial [Bdellovibrionales bacterium]
KCAHDLARELKVSANQVEEVRKHIIGLPSVYHDGTVKAESEIGILEDDAYTFYVRACYHHVVPLIQKNGYYGLESIRNASEQAVIALALDTIENFKRLHVVLDFLYPDIYKTRIAWLTPEGKIIKSSSHYPFDDAEETRLMNRRLAIRTAALNIKWNTNYRIQNERKAQEHPADLTDIEWQQVEPLAPKANQFIGRGQQMEIRKSIDLVLRRLSGVRRKDDPADNGLAHRKILHWTEIGALDRIYSVLFNQTENSALRAEKVPQRPEMRQKKMQSADLISEVYD